MCYLFVYINYSYVNNQYHSCGSKQYFLYYIYICEKSYVISVNKQGVDSDTSVLFQLLSRRQQSILYRGYITNMPPSSPPQIPLLAKQEEMSQLVQNVLTGGIIKPSSSAWYFLLVLVAEKSSVLRFCVHYYKLNNLTKKDFCPLLHANDKLDTLFGTQHSYMLSRAGTIFTLYLKSSKGVFVKKIRKKKPSQFKVDFLCSRLYHLDSLMHMHI